MEKENEDCFIAQCSAQNTSSEENSLRLYSFVTHCD